VASILNRQGRKQDEFGTYETIPHLTDAERATLELEARMTALRAAAEVFGRSLSGKSVIQLATEYEEWLLR
jgi:hypothetical protein